MFKSIKFMVGMFLASFKGGFGKDTKLYENITLADGTVLNVDMYMKLFFTDKSALALRSKQGNIFLVHGDKDGTFSMKGQKYNIVTLMLVKRYFFGEEKTDLVSCYGGMSSFALGQLDISDIEIPQCSNVEREITAVFYYDILNKCVNLAVTNELKIAKLLGVKING